MNSLTTTSTGNQETPINDLRKNIREENTKARNTAKKSLEHVRACGEMLIELKARVHHGTFGFELQQLRIEQRTANNNMRIASNWKHVSDLNRGVRDALKLLTRADDPPSPDPPPAPRPSPAQKPPAVIEVEIVETPPAPANNSEPQEDEPAPLVVDGTKNEPREKSCWGMARDFISTLKPLKAWEERQSLCDVIVACQGRLRELDKLDGKEKPELFYHITSEPKV